MVAYLGPFIWMGTYLKGFLVASSCAAKGFAGAGIVAAKGSIIGGALVVKNYVCATALLAKPVIIYTGMRTTWMTGIAITEWSAARLYSINCIGEGVNGFYNHLFQIASPACTGLLTTHIGLMGVLVASFVITCMWSVYSFIEYIKKTKPANDVINEYNNVRNMVDRNSSENINSENINSENININGSDNKRKFRSVTPLRYA